MAEDGGAHASLRTTVTSPETVFATKEKRFEPSIVSVPPRRGSEWPAIEPARRDRRSSGAARETIVVGNEIHDAPADCRSDRFGSDDRPATLPGDRVDRASGASMLMAKTMRRERNLTGSLKKIQP